MDFSDPRKGFELEELCDHCNGSGITAKGFHDWVPESEVTVFPTHPSHESKPPDPNVDAMEKHGFVARRLAHLSNVDVAVLLAYYAFGLEYEKQKQKGRIWPVLPLTFQGKRIIQRFRKKRPPQLESWRWGIPWDEYTPEI